MADDFLDKVKKMHDGLSPVAPVDEVFSQLEEDLPQPNNALAATGTPFITDAKQLSDPKILDEFAAIVEEIILQDNHEEAVNAITLLNDTLFPLYPDFSIEAPELYHKYQELLVLLQFVALNTVPLPDVQKMLKEKLRFAIEQKIDVKKKLQTVLDAYDDILLEGKIAEGLANAFLSSDEFLGDYKIAVLGRGQKQSPTFGNFIRDYQQTTRPLSGAEQRRGSIERVLYMNQSKNVKGLNADEKKLLFKVLELHDWLQFGDQPLSGEIDRVTASESLPAPAPLPPRPPLRQDFGGQATTAPVELRDRSEEGHGEKLQMTNYKLQINSQIQIPKIQIQNSPFPSLPKRGEGGEFLPPAPLHRKAGTRKQELGIRAEVHNPPSPPYLKGGAPSLNVREGGGELSKVSLNEALYKSSLEELEKIRKQFEKSATSPGLRPSSPRQGRREPEMPAPPLKPTPHPSSPTRGEELKERGSPFSVNEELINAGLKAEQNTDHGVVTPQTPAAPPRPEGRGSPLAAKPAAEKLDHEIDDKLHKLEERIE